MKRLIAALLAMMVSLQAYAAFPTNTLRRTINIDRLSGEFRDWKFKIDGFSTHRFEITLVEGSAATAVSLSGLSFAFRAVQGDTIFIDISNTNTVISSNTVIFSVINTNVPPDGTYDSQLLMYSGLTTNTSRSSGKGKILVTDSLYDNTNAFPFPSVTLTNLLDFLSKSEAVTLYYQISNPSNFTDATTFSNDFTATSVFQQGTNFLSTNDVPTQITTATQLLMSAVAITNFVVAATNGAVGDVTLDIAAENGATTDVFITTGGLTNQGNLITDGLILEGNTGIVGYVTTIMAATDSNTLIIGIQDGGTGSFIKIIGPNTVESGDNDIELKLQDGMSILMNDSLDDITMTLAGGESLKMDGSDAAMRFTGMTLHMDNKPISNINANLGIAWNGGGFLSKTNITIDYVTDLDPITANNVQMGDLKVLDFQARSMTNEDDFTFTDSGSLTIHDIRIDARDNTLRIGGGSVVLLGATLDLRGPDVSDAGAVFWFTTNKASDFTFAGNSSQRQRVVVSGAALRLAGAGSYLDMNSRPVSNIPAATLHFDSGDVISFSGGRLRENGTNVLTETQEKSLQPFRDRWQTLYSNSDTNWTELPMGSFDTVLHAQGSAAAPVWKAVLATATNVSAFGLVDAPVSSNFVIFVGTNFAYTNNTIAQFKTNTSLRSGADIQAWSGTLDALASSNGAGLININATTLDNLDSVDFLQKSQVGATPTQLNVTNTPTNVNSVLVYYTATTNVAWTFIQDVFTNGVSEIDPVWIGVSGAVAYAVDARSDIVLVNTAADLPRILLSTTIYEIVGNITITNGLVLGDATVVRGANRHNDKITTTSAEILFVASNVDFIVHNLSIEATNASVFKLFSGGTNEATIFDMDFSDVKDLGTYDGYEQLVVRDCEFVNAQQGFTFTGTTAQHFVNRVNIYTDITNQTFVAFALGTSSFKSFEVTGNTFDLTNNAQLFMSGETNSLNIRTDGRGRVIDNQIFYIGNTNLLSKIAPDDLQWIFIANPPMPNTRQFVDIRSSNDVTIAIASAGVFVDVKMDGTFSEEVAQRFTSTTNGVITYIGLDSIAVVIAGSLDVSPATGSSKLLAACIAVNGTGIDPSIRRKTISSGLVNGKTLVPTIATTLHTSDTIKLMIANDTDTVNIDATFVDLVITGGN